MTTPKFIAFECARILRAPIELTVGDNSRITVDDPRLDRPRTWLHISDGELPQIVDQPAVSAWLMGQIYQ